jgi:hypothetical protein
MSLSVKEKIQQIDTYGPLCPDKQAIVDYIKTTIGQDAFTIETTKHSKIYTIDLNKHYQKEFIDNIYNIIARQLGLKLVI